MAGHKTIVEALRAHGPLEEKQRVYRVMIRDKGVGMANRFVVSKSPGQASQQVAPAALVSDKEINAALTKAVLEKEEDRGETS